MTSLTHFYNVTNPALLFTYGNYGNGRITRVLVVSGETGCGKTTQVISGVLRYNYPGHGGLTP